MARRTTDAANAREPTASQLTGRRQDALERALSDLVRQKPAKPDKTRRRVTRAEDKPALLAATRKYAQAEQLPVSHLARRHHVSHATVRQALKSPTPPPRKKRPPIVGPAKERVGPTIDAILDEYATTHAGQLPTAREVWEKLLDDHDATVSYGIVHRYLSSHPLKNPDMLISHAELTAGNYLAATQQTFHAAVFKQYRALLSAVRREPARHGLDDTFATTTAFILGLDAGSNWNMLAGFQKWLVVRRDAGHDLTWPILVRHLAPGGWNHPPHPAGRYRSRDHAPPPHRRVLRRTRAARRTRKDLQGLPIVADDPGVVSVRNSGAGPDQLRQQPASIQPGPHHPRFPASPRLN